MSQLTQAVTAADPNALAAAGVPSASIQAVQAVAGVLQPITNTCKDTLPNPFPSILLSFFFKLNNLPLFYPLLAFLAWK